MALNAFQQKMLPFQNIFRILIVVKFQVLALPSCRRMAGHAFWTKGFFVRVFMTISTEFKLYADIIDARRYLCPHLFMTFIALHFFMFAFSFELREFMIKFVLVKSYYGTPQRMFFMTILAGARVMS